MPKRLVVCCDGTWNRPDQLAGGAAAPTNVWRPECEQAWGKAFAVVAGAMLEGAAAAEVRAA